MLNVTAQRSPEAAKSYFAKSDYYSEGQEIVGEWGGKGAVLAGLFGDVGKPAFDALCDNLHPITGKPLTPMTRSGRRTGYDFTWSAPKSVSIVHALTGDERIIEAFRSSIRDTMSEMEDDMQTRVRRGDKQEDRTTGNLLYAEFIHLTSRPVNGVPCPQLHSHCFAFNATFDAEEERWKAGQFGKIKGDGFYWQAVQQARFANALQSLGYSIQKTKDAFEIEGVPKSALDKLSLRTQLIEQVALKLGITDPKAKAKLAATTREGKLDSIPYRELVARWSSMLDPAERASVRSTLHGQHPSSHKDSEHVRYALDHTFERNSVADERRLLTLALRHGVGDVTPAGVRKELNKQPLLKREEDGRTWVTTQRVLDEETRMIRFAARGRGDCSAMAAQRPGWRDELHSSGLSDEQQAVVAHVLTSPDRVMIVRGVAGSGKTTLTRETIRQLKAAGKHAVMLAPSAQASRGVLREEGFKDANTLSAFLENAKLQESARDGVIWLDEAGMVGTQSLVKLFDAAKALNARVVLAGDKRQMASVERGSALRVLEDVAGLTIAEVKEIRRQSGDYKEAVGFLSRGDAVHGLEKLDRMGCIKTLPTDNSYAPVARDYIDKMLSGKDREKSVLIVSPTHAEAAKITDELRRTLKADGLLGEKDHIFTRLVPLQWTEAQRGDKTAYDGDEILQFHRASGDFKAGQRVTAERLLSASRPPRAANFSAYAESTLPLAVGEFVRITSNGKTKDGRHKVNNGAVYTVGGFTRSGDIELSNGWVLDKSFGHLALGYVSTAHAAQGRTVDHAIVVQSALSLPAGSREGFYVSVSRGKKSVTVWTDDKEELKQTVERSQPRQSAVELAARPNRPIASRVRDTMYRMRLARLIRSRTSTAPERPAEKEYGYVR